MSTKMTIDRDPCAYVITGLKSGDPDLCFAEESAYYMGAGLTLEPLYLHRVSLHNYEALCDIWAEANAIGTVLGDQERLMRKIAALRDLFADRPVGHL